MRNTYLHIKIHIIFSTKNRAPCLTEDVWAELGNYISGIAVRNSADVLAVGGLEDHVHILLQINAANPLSQIVGRIKGGSSRWLKQRFDHLKDFTWQEGYAAISVSPSMTEKTVRYIEKQRNRHRNHTYLQEMNAFFEE